MSQLKTATFPCRVGYSPTADMKGCYKVPGLTWVAPPGRETMTTPCPFGYTPTPSGEGSVCQRIPAPLQEPSAWWQKPKGVYIPTMLATAAVAWVAIGSMGCGDTWALAIVKGMGLHVFAGCVLAALLAALFSIGLATQSPTILGPVMMSIFLTPYIIPFVTVGLFYTMEMFRCRPGA